MGGHGTISLYLEGVSDSGEGARYKGVSGFTLILHPVKRPWGDKGFKGCLKVS